VTYTYDYDGNTLTKVVGSNTTSYAWDYENRMTSVTLPGSGGTVTFKYDPFGRRIYKSSSAATSVIPGELHFSTHILWMDEIIGRRAGGSQWPLTLKA
jgi:YD repeat-containing protein